MLFSCRRGGGAGGWGAGGGGRGGRGSFDQPPQRGPSRWDALDDDKRERKWGQGHNRWDNRSDGGDWSQNGSIEDWSKPLPRNERVEQ